MTTLVWNYLQEYETERDDILDAVDTVFRSWFDDAVVQKTPPEHGCRGTSSHASTTAAKIAAARASETRSPLTAFQSRKSSASHSLSSR